METNALAHGMDGTLVEPDWPPLKNEEVRALLSQYPECKEPLTILQVSPRPFSAASVVATDGKNVFVKRHHESVRNHEGLLEEHRFLQHLYQHDAKVPRVLATSTGETAVKMRPWTYEVHEACRAVDLYADALSWTPFRTAKHAFSAGQTMAHLHCAAAGFQPPRRRARPLVASFTILAADDAQAGLDRYLAARPSLAGNSTVCANARQALHLLAPFHAQLRPLLPALPPLWTHNDLHASNLLWSDQGDEAHATAVIDFGLADETCAVHDLAHAIERNIIEWLFLANAPSEPENVPVHLDHLRALLDGYESVRTLSRHEAMALAPMLAVCHAEFALSEADYFLGVLDSPERARMAHGGWLLGHAHWFRSASGQKLLDALHDWTAQRAHVRA
jgi:Ser/Thr protein kinase RdoA (MazF antagonist)